MESSRWVPLWMLLTGAVCGLAFGFLVGLKQGANSNHDPLVPTLTLDPAHYGGSYTMSCVCSNQPAPHSNNRFSTPHRDLARLEPVEQGLAGAAQVVSIGLDAGAVADEFH